MLNYVIEYEIQTKFFFLTKFFLLNFWFLKLK